MDFTPDYTDFYQILCVHSRLPLVADDMSVLCSLPAKVDMDGNIAADTDYISLVVIPAEWRYRDACDYLDICFADSGVTSRQQVGHIHRVVKNG